jgi:hypothetical protein
MSSANPVPDAWDDDWETVADVRMAFVTTNSFEALTIPKKQEALPENDTQDTAARLSKAERKAKHVEANKQLWEAA